MGKRLRRVMVLAAATGLTGASLLVVGGGGAAQATTQPLYLNQHAPIQARVHDLLGRMTLAEKIGQMTQIEVSRVVGNCTNGPGPLNQTCAQSVLGDAAVGSILSGGGSPPTENILGADAPQDWATAVDSVVQYSVDHNPLHIPIIYGADVVHGHNNVQGDTLFPQGIGMGSTYDPALVKAAQQSASDAGLAGSSAHPNVPAARATRRFPAPVAPRIHPDRLH